MMKMKVLAVASTICRATALAAAAFSPHHIMYPRFFHLYGTIRPDPSDTIAEAMKELGATSNEARVAWDILEEMDSNDSSQAYLSEPMIGVNTLTDDYYAKIRSLHYLMEDTNWSMQQMKRLIKEIKTLELKDPSLARLPDGAAGAALKAALSNAKAAVEVHGASSAEATKAWDRLDSCFRADHNGVLEVSDECDIDSEPSSYRYSAAALVSSFFYRQF
jgi:hypothetical protein